MFNMLNTWIQMGKNSPMVCKFLSRMSAFPHGLLLLRPRPFYLLERMGLRNCVFPPVGLRIAFSISRLALSRICSGKD